MTMPIRILAALACAAAMTPAVAQDVRLVPYSASRASATAVWRTGHAYALEFKLLQPARVIVFHVDPQGWTELLYPLSERMPLLRHSAGRVRLTGEQRGMPWRFEGGPGPETYLIAADGRIDSVKIGPYGSLAEIEAAIESALAGG